MTKAGNRNSRVHLIYKICALFACIQVKNHVSIICDIDVRFIVAIKNFAGIAVNRFSDRDIDVKDNAPRIPPESNIAADKFCSHY